MSAHEFDSFLLKTKVGSSRTLRRLTPSERWCFVAGVLALAAESPIRGALLIAEGEPVTVADLADQAGVTKVVAQSTVDKLLRLGKLEHDEELACSIVVRWHAHQVEPKPSDTREAWVERKRKQRAKARRDGHADVPRDVTPLSHPSLKEVEVEVEGKNNTPPDPPASGGRKRDKDRFQEKLSSFAAEHFPGLNPGYVEDAAEKLRRRGLEPTVETIRPLVAEYARTA